MRKFIRNLYLTRISFGLAAVPLLCAANPPTLAQTPPLVYTVENTGAGLPGSGPPRFRPCPHQPAITRSVCVLQRNSRHHLGLRRATPQRMDVCDFANRGRSKTLLYRNFGRCRFGGSIYLHRNCILCPNVGQSLHLDNHCDGGWAEWVEYANASRSNCSSNSVSNVCPTSQWVAVRDWYGIGYRELASLGVQRIDCITDWSYGNTDRLCGDRRIQPE